MSPVSEPTEPTVERSLSERLSEIRHRHRSCGCSSWHGLTHCAMHDQGGGYPCDAATLLALVEVGSEPKCPCPAHTRGPVEEPPPRCIVEVGSEPLTDNREQEAFTAGRLTGYEEGIARNESDIAALRAVAEADLIRAVDRLALSPDASFRLRQQIPVLLAAATEAGSSG